MATSADDSFAVINANIASMVGSKVGINVFTQPYEPGIKEGIWIQTDIMHDSVIVDSIPYTAGSFISDPSTDFPFIYNANTSQYIRNYGNNKDLIYFKNGIGLNYIDMNSGQVSLVANYGRYFDSYYANYPSSICVIDDKVFIGTMKEDASTSYVYSYFEYACFNTSGTLLGTVQDTGMARLIRRYGDTVYFISNYSYYHSGPVYQSFTRCYYTYDLSTNKFIETSIRFNPDASTFCVEIIGDYAYSFGGKRYIDTGKASPDVNTSSPNSYKLNLKTGEQTRISDTPSVLCSGIASSIAVGTDIYLQDKTCLYKYDTLTDEYTLILSGLSMTGGLNPILYKDKIIYTRDKIFSLTSKEYNGQPVVLNRVDETAGVYQTQFYGENNMGENFGRLCSGFNDVWLYHDNDLDQNLPTYYGDGSSWIKIKN